MPGAKETETIDNEEKWQGNKNAVTNFGKHASTKMQGKKIHE